MSLFTPNLMLSHVGEITPALLLQHGIFGIVLDVDNTLTQHNSQLLSDEVSAWLALMKSHNIKLMIASNNHDRRIAPFAKTVALDYYAHSRKPLTFAFARASRLFGLGPREIAVVGDQIYTDILGGNLKGMFTILISPLAPEVGRLFGVKRRLERLHIWKYHRKRHKILQKNKEGYKASR